MPGTEPRRVTRQLLTGQPCSLGVPGKLLEFMAWCNEQLAKIPNDFQVTAEINFDPAHEYGESYPNIEITYVSLETEQERQFRELKAKHEQQQREELSRQEYERLKKIFEP